MLSNSMVLYNSVEIFRKTEYILTSKTNIFIIRQRFDISIIARLLQQLSFPIDLFRVFSKLQCHVKVIKIGSFCNNLSSFLMRNK